MFKILNSWIAFRSKLIVTKYLIRTEILNICTALYPAQWTVSNTTRDVLPQYKQHQYSITRTSNGCSQSAGPLKNLQVLYTSGNAASWVGEETRLPMLGTWWRRGRCQHRQQWTECNENSQQQKNQRSQCTRRQLHTSSLSSFTILNEIVVYSA